MANVFKRDGNANAFSWEGLGDIKEGRADLGEEMPVLVYRLMQFTMLDVLSKEFGAEVADEFFRKAGFLAGSEFAKHTLNLDANFNSFVAELQDKLLALKIGILRMEASDPDTGNMILTVGQDLDCSGLPITNDTVCVYDEGFIAGIFYAFTGKEYAVKEIDCWGTGDRVCRFDVSVEEV